MANSVSGILYRYEFTDGTVYVGRDKMGKYKRAKDHLQNALYATGWKNPQTKKKIFPFSLYLSWQGGFSLGTNPQQMEKAWGKLLVTNQTIYEYVVNSFDSYKKGKATKKTFANWLLQNNELMGNKTKISSYIADKKQKNNAILNNDSRDSNWEEKKEHLTDIMKFTTDGDWKLKSWSAMSVQDWANTGLFNIQDIENSEKTIYFWDFCKKYGVGSADYCEATNMLEFLLTLVEFHGDGAIANNVLNIDIGSAGLGTLNKIFKEKYASIKEIPVLQYAKILTINTKASDIIDMKALSDLSKKEQKSNDNIDAEINTDSITLEYNIKVVEDFINNLLSKRVQIMGEWNKFNDTKNMLDYSWKNVLQDTRILQLLEDQIKDEKNWKIQTKQNKNGKDVFKGIEINIGLTEQVSFKFTSKTKKIKGV